jgi:uncharacterized protein YqjF (DUF2071 family)
MAEQRVFLSAEWRDLVMLNYEVDPEILRPYVPVGVELDTFAGRTFVSLVGFQFLRTKLCGYLAVPFHSNFDEVNLRFYVRRREGGEVRRGVVFVRELVPRMAIARFARLIYGERYDSCPMWHRIARNADGLAAEYGWSWRGGQFQLSAQASGAPSPVTDGALERFITEHYWGYSAKSAGQSIEYRVSHDPWRVWVSKDAGFEGDGGALYGSGFGEILRRAPDSAFIAEGSPVLVHTGRRIERASRRTACGSR